jgi:hypothetical protein
MPDPNNHAVPFHFSEDVPALSPCILSCDQQDNGHEWHPTIIIGYYQCSTCDALGVCTTCVSKVRGRVIAGTCQTHLLRLAAVQAEQYRQQEKPEEVLR